MTPDIERIRAAAERVKFERELRRAKEARVEFIRLCSPDTVIALCDAVDDARAQLAAANEKLAGVRKCIVDWRTRVRLLDGMDERTSAAEVEGCAADLERVIGSPTE